VPDEKGRSLAEELAGAVTSVVAAVGSDNPAGVEAPHGSIPTLLSALEEEERALSARRRKVHERIDLLESAGARLDAAALARLEVFRRSERDFSGRRRALQAEIDRLRDEAAHRTAEPVSDHSSS